MDLLDVEGRTTVTLDDREWTVCPLPWGIVSSVQHREVASWGLMDPVGTIESVPPASDAPAGTLPTSQWVPREGVTREAFGEALAKYRSESRQTDALVIRWGLRAYAVGERGESITYDGRTWRVLSADAVDRVMRVNAGALAARLSLEIQRVSKLSEEDLLGFLAPSG